MSLKFERVAGPFSGPLSGVVWDGQAILFSDVAGMRLLRFDPASGKTEETRKHTGRTGGLAIGPHGELYGCQEGSRRVIEFLPDGSAVVTATKLNGKLHNFPADLTVERNGRIWFSDPHSEQLAIGPQLYPTLDHASVLRLARGRTHQWFLRRMTYDTVAPRAVLLSADQRTLYVSEAGTRSSHQELRAYPIEADDELGQYVVLHTFGADHRGPHRGVEGMCLDSEGNIVACAGWNKSGPGPLIYVFRPNGAVIETHALPDDLPMRCAFGHPELDVLYVTTAKGNLYRSQSLNRRGYANS